MKRAACLGWLALSWVAGCGSPIDAPSDYATAQFLCDDAHTDAWNAAIEACRESRKSGDTCAGVSSFRGVVDRQPIVGTVRALLTSFTASIDANQDAIRSLRFRGPTPYSAFGIHYDFFADGRADRPTTSISYLNFEARGGNYLVGLENNVAVIQVDQPDEFAFSVTATLTRGGNFQGCFHAFLTPE